MNNMKGAIKHADPFNNAKGFTLIELLIGLAIASFVLILIIRVFISTNKLNTIQENVASVQQDIRAAMDIMSTDIMMAGLNASGLAADAGFADNASDNDDTDSNSIAVKYDYDGDGACDIDRCYYYDNANLRLMIRNGAATAQPLTADNTISTVNFSYTLADGSIDSAPDTNGNLDNIRLVTIRICGKISGAYAADHADTYCFSRNIKPRNL